MDFPCKDCLMNPMCVQRLISYIRKEIAEYYLEKYEVIVDAAYETLYDLCPPFRNLLRKEKLIDEATRETYTYKKFCVIAGTKLIKVFPQIEKTFEKDHNVS